MKGCLLRKWCFKAPEEFSLYLHDEQGNSQHEVKVDSFLCYWSITSSFDFRVTAERPESGEMHKRAREGVFEKGEGGCSHDTSPRRSDVEIWDFSREASSWGVISTCGVPSCRVPDWQDSFQTGIGPSHGDVCVHTSVMKVDESTPPVDDHRLILTYLHCVAVW